MIWLIGKLRFKYFNVLTVRQPLEDDDEKGVNVCQELIEPIEHVL
jgi:hypothetical protein